MGSHPIQDKVAVAGIGTTAFSRSSEGSSLRSLAIDAAQKAIVDSGVPVGEIDGVITSRVFARELASDLGLGPVHYWLETVTPLGFHLSTAMAAIHSGLCEAVLCCHASYRTGRRSRSASQDPFRARAALTGGVVPLRDDAGVDSLAGPGAYAAWAQRYMHDHHIDREAFGRIAINERSNAALNPHAVNREPLTMEGYLAARMIRYPLSLLDMDLPIDGADAIVVVRSERAYDLPSPVVLVHAMTLGMASNAYEWSAPDIDHTGQNVTMDSLWRRSDIELADIDVFLPYDGFTFIALKWFESVGYCSVGDAADFVAENWHADTNSIRIGGKVAVNTHGGSLSEGAMLGTSHVREAISQLRGHAYGPQVPGAATALVTLGGFFFNCGAAIFRVG
jgi:acetyl-CoA acetyltransferase